MVKHGVSDGVCGQRLYSEVMSIGCVRCRAANISSCTSHEY